MRVRENGKAPGYRGWQGTGFLMFMKVPPPDVLEKGHRMILPLGALVLRPASSSYLPWLIKHRPGEPALPPYGTTYLKCTVAYR